MECLWVPQTEQHTSRDFKGLQHILVAKPPPVVDACLLQNVSVLKNVEEISLSALPERGFTFADLRFCTFAR